MDHPLLVPSNNGNRSRRNYNQTCTKQPTKKLLPKNKKKLPITQEFDPISSINTVEIARSTDILQAALRPFTIFKYDTYQTK